MSSTEDQAPREIRLNTEEEAASRTFAHDPGEGEAWWWFGVLATFKATGEQTGGQYALVEILAPDGYEGVRHVHHFEDEGFYILEGEMTFYFEDGQPIPASAGSFVHIPKGYVPHAFQVDSETARFLVLTRPPHEHFLRAAAEPAQARTLPPEAPLDMEKVGAAAQEYGMEILGPPPGASA